MTDDEKAVTKNNIVYTGAYDVPKVVTLSTATKLETEYLTASKKQKK